MEDEACGTCITKIVAFGGINTEHEKIQDIDVGVKLEPKLGREITGADLLSALKAVRGILHR
jgi:hypothetical protein